MSGSNFALQNGNCHGQHADGDTLDGASDNERSEVGSKDLDSGRDKIDDGAYAHRHASTEDIAYIRREKCREKRGDIKTGNGDGYDRR